MNDWPNNQKTFEAQRATERTVSAAFMQYLASSSPFAEWKEEQSEWEELMVRCMYHCVNGGSPV